MRHRAFHIHHGAHQILICVSGEGIYQEWGKPAIRLHAGDIIDIPEGAKHWHGATKESWFQHLATHVEPCSSSLVTRHRSCKHISALATPSVHVGDPESNEWLETVNGEQYEETNK